jgi:hypothetical protein
MVRDDTDDMINHVVYHYFEAAQLGQPVVIPPELAEEEDLAMAVLISKEEKRAFLGFEDALALSVALPPRPRPPPLQPPWTPPRPRHDVKIEPWGVWPGAMPTWPTTSPPVIGWAPSTPTPTPRPPPPPMADCP